MPNLQVGVVADDITGANDIAVMYAKTGISANVFSNTGWFGARVHPSDVVVFDTDSRFLPAQEAYRRVYEATQNLVSLGAERFYKKTCSVFRGNIGIEFDAMLDALEESFAVVVLGFPDNGRTTVDGVHYVRGVQLEQSEFKNDPMNPMRESDLVKILRAQTSRQVSLLDWKSIDRGAQALEKEIDAHATAGGYLIVDVRDNADLAVIAQATQKVRVLCGASAIAFEQGKRMQSKTGGKLHPPPRETALGILSVSASLMPQTRAQIVYAAAHGAVTMELSVVKLLDSREAVCRELEEQACKEILRGKHVLVYSDNDSVKVAVVKQLAREKEISEQTLAKLVSQSLAEICAGVLRRTGQNRVLVAGGDTSASFCEQMKIEGMAVYQEIESGLPSSISLSDPPLFIVLKSGSFGSENFFCKAYEHLLNA